MQPKRSLSSEFELVLTNWSQTRGLEFSLDKTVLYHYFEVSFLSRNCMGEFVRCIIIRIEKGCGYYLASIFNTSMSNQH